MKGFSDEERDQIRSELIEAGRELFTTLGLERTRVRDVTSEVDIGTSTFYQFFESKGALYLTVLDKEIERIAQTYEGELECATDIQSEVRLGLTALFEELETNSLFYRSVVENERQQLLRDLPPDQQQEKFREGQDMLAALAEQWTSHPQFKLDDPEIVVDLLMLLPQTVRLREHFETLSSVKKYENARDLLIDALVQGLID